jgi:hypothetical protein
MGFAVLQKAEKGVKAVRSGHILTKTCQDRKFNARNPVNSAKSGGAAPDIRFRPITGGARKGAGSICARARPWDRRRKGEK